MRWRDLFYLIHQNLWRMKLRVAMTSIGVLIGTTAIILLVALGSGLQGAAMQDVGSFGDLTEITVYPNAEALGAPMVNGNLPRQDTVLDAKALDRFRSLPGVEFVTPILQFQGNAQLHYRQLSLPFPQILGIPPQALKHLDMTVQSGSLRLGPKEIILGGGLLENAFDARSGKPLSPQELPDLSGQVIELVAQKYDAEGNQQERRMRLRVAAILSKSGGQRDYSVYIAQSTLEDLNRWSTGQRPNYARYGYAQVLVKVSDQQYTLQVQNAILQDGYVAFSAQSIVQGVNQFFLVIKIVLGSVGGIALVVAGFGIANAMIMAIYERTREIGLMKAVGARNRDVLFIFLGEAATIGALGGAGGVLLSIGLGALINLIAGSYFASQAAQNGVLEPQIPSLVHISPFLALFAVAFAAGIGLVAGIYPALRATRLSPIQALRYE